MNIQSINTFNTYKNKQATTPSFTSAITPKLVDSVHFANPIIEQLAFAKTIKNRKYLTHFSNEELCKLEGIQRGLKTFNGFSMNEIRYSFSHLDTIAMIRGCFSNCSHCYAEAQKPFSKIDIAKDSSKTSIMDWDDFQQLVKDTKTLEKRVGHPVLGKTAVAFFYDSDLMFYENKGKTAADVVKLWTENIDTPVQFDTAGWSIHDQKRNKIAKELCEVVNKNPDRIEQVCVSINPFSNILERTYQLEKEGKIEDAERFRQIYIKRMANTIYSLAPCTKHDKLMFIINALADTEEKNPREMNIFFKNTFIPIFGELAQLAQKDPNNYGKASLERIMNPEYITKGFSFRPCTNEGRAAQFFSKSTEPKNKSLKSFIDVNGKIYQYSGAATNPTELQLNFKNSDKITSKINNYSDEKTITREEINRINDPLDKDSTFYVPGIGDFYIGKSKP